ncbi:RWD domain-containing protein 3 isoform X3 [Cyprinodon tularosa]|uniref:RWD domain-containing protein 3 isoform X3 n=1 Tax=Cyprinodon tularosa TaxID=77115 RepID=UPI0018E1E702|nr:RWD domain-containing protein 3 isoform X3 [Cyprinodon tularosa]
MADAAMEEVSVLSSIYCRDGELQVVQQSAEDGLVVQLNCASGRDGKLDVGVVFHLDPAYPSRPPHISVSSTSLSKAQCFHIRQKLKARAAELPQEPMLHQLLQYLQDCLDPAEMGGEEEAAEEREQQRWTAVLLLDHIRSRNHYISLLEHWSQQLQVAGRILLGHSILIVLLGGRSDIKEFCRRLKTVKVDVDSSGKKCKERMMKVLAETPSPPGQHSFQGFAVKSYTSSSELSAVFEELDMAELFLQLLPSLSG